jgi:hypothetical protein
MDQLPLPEVVSRRIKSEFGPTYLTLMSVMQGVALAALGRYGWPLRCRRLGSHCRYILGFCRGLE